ncbi:MAG: CotH kinase family protein [Prevotellaceae bacterium]|nr:CotH kinase family protein [Prevotellaceae bacterium]
MKSKIFAFLLLGLFCTGSTYAAIDLVVTSVSWSPANPVVGDQIVFSAVITNQGNTAKNNNTKIGVTFTVNGSTTWCDTYKAPLAAGASTTVTANSSVSGINYWTAPSAGSFTVTVVVDDDNLTSESNENNNTKIATVIVAAPTTDVTIQALGNKTNLNNNGSNFAALIVKSTSPSLGTVSGYEWQLKIPNGFAWARYGGKNYNNNNIRPTAAGTYRCKVNFTGNSNDYFSNEIVITTTATPSANYQNGSLTTNLPIIVVYTGNNQFPTPANGSCGGGYPSKDKIDVDVKILWNANGNNNSLASMSDNASVYYDRKAVMNYRGSTSRSMIKRSYAFSTGKKDLEGTSVVKGKVDLFGLPEEKDWILYAAYNDKSMMRNKLALDLYGQMGHYSSSTRFVELFINDVYQGVYVFLEKYEENENRIKVTNISSDKQPENIGYIIKFDKVEVNETTWKRTAQFLGIPNCGMSAGCGISTQGWELSYPEPEDATEAGVNYNLYRDYIKNWLKDFEVALYNANTNEQWENLFKNYIDVLSFVDFMIMDELARNTDGYRISMWFTKDAGGKLKCTPIWDFEMGFGNDNKSPVKSGGDNPHPDNGSTAYATDIWQFNSNKAEPYFPLPFWYGKLMENQCFKDIFRTRWEELRQNVLSQTHIFDEEMANNANILQASAALDREMNKWSWATRNGCTCNYDYCPWMIMNWPANYEGVGNPAGKTTTYTNEYNLLKAWINSRINWMDSQISNNAFGTVLTEQQVKECAKITENIVTENKPAQVENGITIVAENGRIDIQAKEKIQSISIYDTGGILLIKKNDVNLQEFSLKLPETSRVLIASVQTTSQSLRQVVLVK